ncbi:MAG: ferrous iron transporter B [Candidatus Omnitrophica bacterium]|nr:ferrous iron transporter B [Candidatus Omnitrophota bacterium]
MKSAQPQKVSTKIFIVGLPNTGKSQVYNNLTGGYNLVGNYPFTTVEPIRGRCRIRNHDCEVVDTPGLHSLLAHSEDEAEVRRLIFREKPDVIVQCIDANRLKQSLVLTADLIDLGLPLVISLNAVDETTRQGIYIDSKELSRMLGVTVVESVATQGIGSRELAEAIFRAGTGKPLKCQPRVTGAIEEVTGGIPDTTPFRRLIARLLMLKDPYLFNDLQKDSDGSAWVSGVQDLSAQVTGRFNGGFAWDVNRSRSGWIDEMTGKVVRRHQVALKGLSQTFADATRHPLFGVFILMGILLGMYYLVVNVANNLAGWMDAALWVPVHARLDTWIGPGIVNEFLIGDYGILSLGIANAFLTVLPILSVFFLAFNVLEDIGYIPNLCVLTRRIFEKVGLSGSAVMPLVLGFGCKTMATLTTKSLRSQRERYIAIYLIAFAIPCAAQMGLNMSILGHIGVQAFAIAFGVLAGTEIAAGMILNQILAKEACVDYIQELPRMRMPDAAAILKKTYFRLKSFLDESVMVFVYAAAGLFVADKIGLLGGLKVVVQPVIVGFLGLPLEMVDALILCMARHEAAAALIIDLVGSGKLNNIQCIVAVTLTTMFVPCMANIAAMIKELGLKSALLMTLYINMSAFLIAGTLNWVLIWGRL